MTVKIRRLDLPERPLAGTDTVPAVGRPVRALATALFLAFVAVYFFTLSVYFAPDGVAFARLVDAGRLDRPGFFQAEHLLYPFIGWVWYQVWRFFGFEQGSLAALQILNIFLGAAGVTAIFLAMRLAFRGRRRTLLPTLAAALAVGTTHAYWLHSTDAEDMIPSVAAVALAFCVLLICRNRRVPGRRLPVTLGLLLGLSFLLHGTQILFWPVALLGLYLPRRDARSAAWAGGAAVILVAMAFAIVGIGALGFRSPGDFVAWGAGAPGVGVWGRLDPRNLVIGLRTAIEAVVTVGDTLQLRALLGGSFASTTIPALFGAAGVLVVAIGTAAVLFRTRRRPADGWLVAVCLGWLVLSGLFAMFWAPEDVQFWITPILPASLLVLCAYFTLQASTRTPHDLLAGLSLFGLTSLITINAVTSLVPRTDITANVDYWRTICLRDRLPPTDLVISAGWDGTGTYVPYFTTLDYLSVIDIFVGPGRRDAGRTRDLIRERLAAARDRGGRAWTVHLFDLDSSEQVWFERATGLSPADLNFLRGDVAGDCFGAPIRGVPPS